MDDMNGILELMTINDCNEETFFSQLHHTLLLFVLEEVCQKLKSTPAMKDSVRSEFRRTKNHTKLCIRLVYDICGTKLTESDGLLLSSWIQAFFRKSDIRKPVPLSEKARILSLQDYKCACCNQPLKIEDSHYDHIIPWDYVGDELTDNYQMLCSYCNEHKSNNIHYLLKRQIVKKNTGKE